MLWSKISSLFELAAEPEAAEGNIAEAIAVLLIHAGRIDGQEDEEEQAKRDQNEWAEPLHHHVHHHRAEAQARVCSAG